MPDSRLKCSFSPPLTGNVSLVHNLLPRSRAQPQKEKCAVLGRQKFLPMDIHKAALWKQKPFKLFIVPRPPTLAARSEFIMR